MKTAIHTPTQESYDKVMKKFKREGYQGIPDDDAWGQFGIDTYLNVEDGIIGYFDKNYYEARGCTFITAEEYLGEWKQGDILVDKEGYKCKILGICGEIYFVSVEDDFSEPGSRYYTKETIKDFGFELKKEKEDTEDKTKEAMELLKEKGYRIIKK